MTIASILSRWASFIPGFRLVDGGDLLDMANQLFATNGPVTALAGGGQSGATQLKAGLNLVGTAGAGGTDSVMLPLAIPGAQCVVQNDATNAIQVFGSAGNPNNLNAAGNPIGDTIAVYNSSNYAATGTGVTQAASTVTEYYCIVMGKWKQAQT